MAEFVFHEDRRAQYQKLVNICEQLLKSEYGRAALKEHSQTPMDEVGALKQNGIACVELGELDETIKCFEKAKELEKSPDLPSESTRKINRITCLNKEMILITLIEFKYFQSKEYFKDAIKLALKNPNLI